MAVRQDASTGTLVNDGNPDSKTDANQLRIKVYSPFRTYYDDAAKSISAINQTGSFDVLPQHHKFISLVEPCELGIVILNGNTQNIKIAGGIMHVRDNYVTVLLDV